MSTAVMEVEIEQFEQTGLSVRDEARAIQIVDQATYDLAAEKFHAVSALEKQIIEHYSPMKTKAHEAHKAVCTAEKEMLAPVQDAKRILSRGIGEWDAEQERRRREEQRRLEGEAQAREEAERLANAIEVEQSGADAEEVEAVLSTPAPAIRVQAPVQYQKASTVSTREVWSAELTSLKDLVKAAAQNPAYLMFLQANMPQLNNTARAQKQAFNVPGAKAVVQRLAANRGR